MDLTKIVLGFIIGASFTTFAAMVCLFFALYLTNNVDKLSVTLFWVSTAYIIFYAVISGGVTGAIITALNQSILINILIGFLLNLFFGVVLLFRPIPGKYSLLRLLLRPGRPGILRRYRRPGHCNAEIIVLKFPAADLAGK